MYYRLYIKHSSYFKARDGYFVLALTKRDLERLFLADIVLNEWKVREIRRRVLVTFRMMCVDLDGGRELYVYSDCVRHRCISYFNNLVNLVARERAKINQVNKLVEAFLLLLELIADEIKNRRAEKIVAQRLEEFKASDIYVSYVIYSKL